MANQIEIVGLSENSNSLKRVKTNDVEALNVNIQQFLSSFAQDYSGAQTNLTIITPSSGKKIEIIGVYTSTSTVNVDVTLDFATSGNIVFKLYTAQKATDSGIPCHHDGEVDESLRLTCGANTFICVSYMEHN